MARVRGERLTAFAMLSPSLVGVGLFLLAPIFFVLVASLTDWNLISPPRFVGLDNYAHILGDPGFRRSILVTAAFSLMAIPAAVAAGTLMVAASSSPSPSTAGFPDPAFSSCSTFCRGSARPSRWESCGNGFSTPRTDSSTRFSATGSSG